MLAVAPAIRVPGAEAELAERLDTVLAIVGRLAASHDRAELVRMIVDETRRVLHVDATVIRALRDDRLDVMAWAGIADEAARRLPHYRRDEGWVAEVLQSGHVLAYPDAREERSAGTSSSGRGSADDGFVVAGRLAAPLVH